MKSIHGRHCINLLKDVLNIPMSTAYKYWLVKVELSKLIRNIPFTTLHYIIPAQRLQDDCIGKKDAFKNMTSFLQLLDQVIKVLPRLIILLFPL